MTWVIGFPTVFGYCLGLADVQATITFVDGSKKYFDSVQKIFPVSRFVAVGFSGTIKTGFTLIDDLRQWSRLPNDGTAWIPDCLVQKWRRRARRIYSKLPWDTKGKVRLILLGVYPQRNNGNPGEAQTYSCVMDSPDFEPRKINPGKVASIGSGNEVNEYAKKVEDFQKEGYNPLMQMEVGNRGGYGQALLAFLSTVVNDTRVDGVSNHLHYCYVDRRGVMVGVNDYSIYPPVGEKIDIKMPNVATSWEEFVELMNEEGVNLANAEAVG